MGVYKVLELPCYHPSLREIGPVAVHVTWPICIDKGGLMEVQSDCLFNDTNIVNDYL